VPSDDLLVPLTLVVGDEELLVGRAVSQVVEAAREVDPETDVRDLTAGELQRGDLDEVLAPSLFGERRVVVLRAAQDLVKEVHAELTAYLADPLSEVALVVVHAGGPKGKALLTALAAGKLRRVDVPKITKTGDRRDFVRRELRADGRAVEEEAVGLLLESVGNDLRELASAAGQLLSDAAGPITVEVVQRYHRGRAESSGFAVADRAVDGDLAGALELARWGASTGLAPVLVTSALASTLRSMAQVSGSSGVPAGQLASQLGMPPWKVDKTRRQLRGWRPESLSAAVRAVADADADVKGAAVDAPYAVERALMRVVQARDADREASGPVRRVGAYAR
jgi:DNA polymerase-3 subunit delta